MEILNFVKKLLPRIERSTVAEDLRTTEKELSKVALPAWKAARDYFKISKIQSDDVKGMQVRFQQYFNYQRANKGINFISDIEARLEFLLKNCQELQVVVDTTLEKDIITQGVTLRSAYLIRSAANISLVSRYLLSLLNYIYMAETRHRDNELSPSLEISKAEVRYVEDNFIRFVKLFSEYTQDPEQFKKKISELPEIYVNDRTKDMIKSMMDTHEVDPLEPSGLAGFIGNPIYAIRLQIAQWQNERYESAKAKKQQLELRLIYIQSREKGRNDPTIEREIEILQNRIERYDAYIHETEEKLGV